MDGIFNLVRFVIFLYEFSRQAHGFVRGVSEASSLHDAERAEALQRTSRQIVRAAIATVMVGSVIVPCAAPWVGVMLHGIRADDAALRMVLGVSMSLALAILYLFAGVALGCLLAPPDFLRSRVGAKWMELIGTRTMASARIVCGLVVAVGWGVMFGFAALLIFMAPMT